MAVINVAFNEPGLVNVIPGIVYIATDSTLATVLTRGFLTASQYIYGQIYNTNQAALVTTTDQGTVFLQVVIEDQQISLQASSVGGRLLWETGGSTSHLFSIQGITPLSTVCTTLVVSTNPVSILSSTPFLNSLLVTFSSDPGPDTVVAYLL